MAKIKHHNRQAKRSRKILQKALLDLLHEKNYNKITISDITRKADLARPTFYAHYKTKDHLLTSIIDGYLEGLFLTLEKANISKEDSKRDIQLNINFFKTTRESYDVVNLMKSLDIDSLFLERFKYYWGNFLNTRISTMQNTDPKYNEFIKQFLTYSMYAILKRWIETDMELSDEIMGTLLYNLTGPPTLKKARHAYHKSQETSKLSN